MQCPECGKQLNTVEAAGVTLDICDTGCGGVWFDQGELARFDEADEPVDGSVLDITPTTGEVELPEKMDCPKCDGVVMMRHYSSMKRGVLVDECPNCGGYWLDPGELRKIRAEYTDDDARDDAAEQLMDEMFGAQIAEQQADSAEELARARRVAKMLRFICPSNYIPGKQDGAAF